MKLFLRKAGPLLRLIGIAAVLAGAFAYAQFQGGAVSWTVFYMVLPFSLYGIFLYVYPLRAVTAEREVDRRELQHGSPLRSTVRLGRRFMFPLLYISMKEVAGSAAQIRMPSTLFIWGFRRRKEWSYETEPLKRGEHVLEGIEIEAADFFGWMRKSRFIPLRQTITVLPKVTDMREVPSDASEERGSAAASFTAVRESSVATGIRDYQPGDRLSRIHWPAFARTGELHSKGLEDRRAQDLLLVLDGSPSPQFEEQVGFAASILKKSVETRSAAGFLSLGESGMAIPRVEGPDSLRTAMLHLARFNPSAEGGQLPPAGSRSLAAARTMTVITGPLTEAWINAFLREARQASGGILFSVLGKGEHPGRAALEAARIAIAAGFDVRFVTEREFGDPERGGVRR
ncbi:hypothetical protein AV656_09450 [Bhargavaea cecembensis]|uniref:DUF58 domain-containing protein n=1 Tax=Bhargavaea cecembensis TaxID=394098 RepID=A0A163F1T6_9BACL|nr:DUF58 domain-containing protein [Bhargavaea cecembensis]KZE37747.1 hypothetical protein AV656_09450 [Bhargavaea cecembensis]